MNIWLDDKRPMPPGFDVHCLNAHHVAKLIRCGLVDLVSLDHDLGEEAIYGTGYTVAKEIEELVCTGKLKRRLTVMLHSMNPVGVSNMRLAIYAALQESDVVTLLEPEAKP